MNAYGDEEDDFANANKHIKIFKNGAENSKKYVTITLRYDLKMSDILSILEDKINFGNVTKLRIFTPEGVEIFEEDLPYVKNHAILFASKGEDFDAKTSFAEYKKTKVLGEGGFGKVILGEHKV